MLRRRITAFLIFLLPLIAFSPILSHSFSLIDDPQTIAINPRLNPPTLSGPNSLLWYWSNPEFSLYIPVTYSVWGALAALSYVPTPDETGLHLDPSFFHATSLLLHAIGALALCALFQRLLKHSHATTTTKSNPQSTIRNPQSPIFPAAAAALLWALHPLQTESLAWTSGMKDVLAGVLSITALWLYVRSTDDQLTRRQRAVSYSLALVAFAAALLSKPSAMTLPASAFAIDWLILRRPIKRIVLWIAPLVLLALPIAIIARLVQPGSVVPFIPLHERPIVAGASLAFYLQKFFLPINLAFDYGWRPPRMLQLGWFRAIAILPAILIVLAIVHSIRSRRAVGTRTPNHWPLVALALFIVPLLPVLGFLPFLFQYYSTVADHYAYVALIGPAFVVACLLNRISAGSVGTLKSTANTSAPNSATPASRATVPVAIAVLTILGILSARQSNYWRDDATFYTHCTVAAPDGLIGHNGLGRHYLRNGDDALAELELKKAVALNPDFYVPREGLISLYAKMGRTSDTIREIHAIIDSSKAQPPGIRFDYNDAFYEAGLAHFESHQPAQAIPYLEEALRHRPADEKAKSLLARARSQLGR